MSGKAYRPLLASLLALSLGQGQASEILATKLGLVSDPWSVMQIDRRVEWGGQRLELADLCREPSWQSMSRQAVAQLALCRNASLDVAWRGWQAAAAREGQNLAAYLPTIRLIGGDQRRSTPSIDAAEGRPNLVVSGEREITRRNTISSEWTLLTFGARSAAFERVRYQAEAARLEYENQVDTVLLDALVAFENLLGTQEVARLQQQSLSKAQESVTLAATRYSHSVGSLADVKLAEAVLLRAQIELERTQTEISQRRSELAAVLSLSAAELDRLELIQTGGDGKPVEVGDFLSKLHQHKELQAAQAAWIAARSQVTAVEREANPVVSASVSYGNRFSQRRDQPANPPFDNREWTVGLQYSLPLFSGFSGHYKLREAQSQADYQLRQSDVVRDRLQSTGLQNQQALRLEQMQLESWVRVVELSLFNMSATRERYLRGVSDINFILNAEREAAAALTEQSRAQTRFQIAKWKHLRDMGEIRDSIR